ncbi:tRNA-intron endonuclease catalytic domain-like protein [Myriangium duriaei CBS 260.36]|uniref:tRNA-intron lyase n=1 Tax=Myriangium duriaei CBS 260.36 TaxID=1168546 RepID=A0A9P4MIQ8_9PEZI|nr:tRNA-intron endonuclease catalytic domain-like protein [Myriangium duriaei CBS 260.36]
MERNSFTHQLKHRPLVTSYPPMRAYTPSNTLPLPAVPGSYPLFAYLHSKGYFLSPGLRFGCRYVAYPGDPLRFHSHFLVEGKGWNDKFELMEVVTGGRLGTGVKKGFLLGGVEEGKEKQESDGNVRAFTIEWAGM